ncbi:MAG: cupin domain-containing protein [Pseudomonadota bacterium]
MMPPVQLVRSSELSWEPSPRPGVWRKRLFHEGGLENGTVTSLVRFDPGASFQSHDHPGGEEIIVLSGVFSDHQGDHGKETHLLNPEGYSHAPFTEMGCLLFVRLRQYAGTQQLTTDLPAGDNPSGMSQITLGRESGSMRWFLSGALGKDKSNTVEGVLGLGGQEALKSLACFAVSGSFHVGQYALNEHDWLSINSADDVRELSLTGDGQLYMNVELL